MIMDVDGTLTDGKIHIGENGEVFKSFNVKDGYGIVKILPMLNIKPCILTGRLSKIVLRRANELNISLVFQNISDKKSQIDKICRDMKIDLKDVIYIGDDLNDIEALKLCGFKACPNDACDEVKSVCDYVSTYNGGDGAVRDIINFLNKDRT